MTSTETIFIVGNNFLFLTNLFLSCRYLPSARFLSSTDWYASCLSAWYWTSSWQNRSKWSCSVVATSVRRSFTAKIIAILRWKLLAGAMFNLSISVLFEITCQNPRNKDAAVFSTRFEIFMWTECKSERPNWTHAALSFRALRNFSCEGPLSRDKKIVHQTIKHLQIFILNLFLMEYDAW